MDNPLSPDSSSVRSLSLRDPAGSLYEINNELIRHVHPHAVADLHSTQTSPSMIEFVARGSLVKFWEITETEKFAFLIPTEHSTPQKKCLIGQEKIPFVNYPYEWAPAMLKEAGLLTLEIAERLSAEGLGLKDATPFNILYSGHKAVFVDILSVERRDPCDSLWLAYSQFTRTFINPLLLFNYFGIPLVQSFLISREGISPFELYQHCNLLQKCSPAFFSTATLPVLLEGKSKKDPAETQRKHLESNPEKAQFILQFLFKRLRRSLKRIPLSHTQGQARFSDYMGKDLPYSKEQFLEKEQFVQQALELGPFPAVLDLGCNEGHFSRLAAKSGSRVVAVDSEPEVVSRVWEQARAADLNILPLVINLANPSPASGWKNKEQQSFLDRARGQFDCVFMLALVHHLLTTEGIPLAEILDLAQELTKSWLVLEWVSPKDPMFLSLSLGKDFSALSAEHFEKLCQSRFEIHRKQILTGKSRILYLLKKKNS